MLRYNHGLVEAKWRKTWEKADLEASTVVSVTLVPQSSAHLQLENARLLVLADFFAWVKCKARPAIGLCGAREDWLEDASRLGLVAKGWSGQPPDLVVTPRDYPSVLPADRVPAPAILSVGRLLETEHVSLAELLGDFGGDALRVYFLYMGPPERDYRFHWYGLVSAYRFVTRLWQLGQGSCRNHSLEDPQGLLELQVRVQDRLSKQKPHTALAAIMGYLKGKTELTSTEIRSLAALLQPFTPFVSAELLQLMAAIEDHNSGERHYANT